MGKEQLTLSSADKEKLKATVTIKDLLNNINSDPMTNLVLIAICPTFLVRRCRR